MLNSICEKMFEQPKKNKKWNDNDSKIDEEQDDFVSPTQLHFFVFIQTVTQKKGITI